MKSEDILDAIGNVDDECIKKAKEKKKSKKALWITLSSVAACLVVVFLLPNIINFIGFVSPDSTLDTADSEYNTTQSETDIAVLEEDVWIYYVDGDEISRNKQFLPCTPQDVFSAWKKKNGIGDEVKLIKVKIDSNSTTTTSEFQGSTVVEHNVGDRFVYNITVSANIKDYYQTIDENLLLQSLEKTMIGYSNIEYEEYNIMFE